MNDTKINGTSCGKKLLHVKDTITPVTHVTYENVRHLKILKKIFRNRYKKPKQLFQL